MIFKCKNCGGNVVYSPEKHTMLCPYCDSEKSEERKDYPDARMEVCPNCGGEVPVEEHMSATRCPYCDNYLIFNARVEGEFEPKLIVPFQMGKETCKKEIRKKFEKCLFAPTDFLSEVRLNGMKGIYVPFWFYDYDTHCDFHGEGKKVRSWTTGNMQYTETSYYDIYRDMDFSFRRIPVDASKQMPDDVMDLVEPFHYEQLEEFKPEYLSGFYAEKYNETSDFHESRARKKMNEDVDATLKTTYSGYSDVKTVARNNTPSNISSDYGLMPIWNYQYKYKGKEYPFYVNGQTGKIVGMAPVSKGKVWAYAGTLWGCITLALVCVNLILNWL